jgi:predicted RNA-binding protein with RPS1 domain/anti-sigma regulatory factor (Ser/Thr protein kinase)
LARSPQSGAGKIKIDLNQLAKGQVRKGVVSSIVNFGAFVDLGGVDGLVHISELSWKHIDHPGEVVEVGQEVTVEVLDVDLERERVSLSLKATQEDPWRQFTRTRTIGQIVPGKVTKLVPFGAFVRVEEGIEGLVHISELAERHVEIPEQVVQVGDDVMVKVIDIDLDRRRISLSLKQANEGLTPDMEFDPTQYGMAAEYDTEGRKKSTTSSNTPADWSVDVQVARLHTPIGSTSERVNVPAQILRLTVPAQPSRLTDLRRGLREWLRQAGVAKNDAAGVLIAVSEAAANAVEHAYLDIGADKATSQDGVLQLTAWLEPGGVLRVEVVDNGRWRQPDTYTEQHGRGFRLMRSTMDEVNVEHATGTTTVAMRLKLDQRVSRAY